MRLRTAMILLLAAGCLVLPATGGDDGPGSAVERQVRQALGKLVKSYNAHDTEAVAACWAVDAVYVDRDSDAEIVGREKLLEAYKEIFQRHPQIEMVADVHSVRVITPDVAQLRATVTVTGGEEDEGPDEFVAVLKKVKGEWLLDNAYEIGLPRELTPRDHLEPLAWLVGQWADDSPDVEVRNEFRFSAKETFLIRSYHAERDGERVIEGTQIFGWDPRQEEIKTWLFNSDGAFGDGTCEVSDNRVVIRLRGTTSDGRSASLTQVLTRQSAGKLTSQFMAIEVDGELQPTPEPVTLLRTEAKKKATKSAATKPKVTTEKAADSDKTPLTPAPLTKGAKVEPTTTEKKEAGR